MDRKHTFLASVACRLVDVGDLQIVISRFQRMYVDDVAFVCDPFGVVALDVVAELIVRVVQMVHQRELYAED